MNTSIVEEKIIKALSATLRNPDECMIYRCLCNHEQKFHDGLMKNLIDAFHRRCIVCGSDSDKIITTGKY